MPSAGYDALGNVAGATLSAIASTFGFVLARRADAPPFLIPFGVAAMFAPSLLAWIAPLLCRWIPLGAAIMGLRLLAGLAMIPCLLHPSLATFFTGYLVVTICIGLSDYCYPSLLKILYQADEQRRFFGVIYALRATLMLVLFLLIGSRLDHVSVMNGFRLLALSGLLLGVLAGAFTTPFRHIRDRCVVTFTDSASKSPLANPMFVRYLVILSAFGVGNAAFLVIWPNMAVKPFNLTNTEVGVLQALSMVSQLIAYSWFSRFGRVPRTLRPTAVLFPLYALPCFAALALMWTGGTHGVQFWVLLFFMVLFNFGVGIWTMYFYLLVNAMAGDDTPLPYHATQGVVVGVRGVIVPFIFGAIYHYFGLACSLWLTAGFFLLASVIAIFSRFSIPRVTGMPGRAPSMPVERPAD